MFYNNEFNSLKNITSKPEVWSVCTSDMLWTDEHISKKMLEHHLNPDSEPASRPHSFINKSAAWISRHFNLSPDKSVIDFGCGPGLYTSRFCMTGAKVAGVDFSERSLNYAVSQSRKANHDIVYIRGNYLDVELEGKYDLVTMIYCDYCALSPAQRITLLGRFKSILKKDGKVLMDVFTDQAYSSRAEASSIEPNLMEGFWSADDYVGISQTWKYDDEKVVLDKYDIINAQGVRTVYNWLQYYSRNLLEKEIESQGFRISELYSDVGGGILGNESPTMAVVLEANG